MKSQQFRTQSTFTTKKRGFALVVTLSLMILLTVIAVGLLSLATVSLRSSAQASAGAVAEANARMALMLAIGELQKQLGPDQRVSMTADQRTNPNSEGDKTSAADGNRHWTGVFDSWPTAVDARPTPVFRSWLVSGDPDKTYQLDTATTALTAASTIDLVGIGTLGSAGTGQVKASAVNLTEGGIQVGRMAWWVGDQGVKAAIGTQPMSTETTQAAIRSNLQGAPRNAIELASADSLEPFSALKPNDPRTPLVTSWQQSAFLASNPAAPKPLFHDLAAWSTGLLTNVRSGGFRKDLTMKLESHTSPPDLSASTSQPKSPNVLYYVDGEEGINFQELWAYYHLYKQLRTGGGGNFTTGGSIPSSAPYLQTANSVDAVTQDNWDRYKQPITINYQVVLSFEMQPAPTPKHPGKQALFVNMDPIITLWNPLDVPVDVAPHTDDRGNTKCWMYIFWAIPYDINVQVNGGAIRKCSIMRSTTGMDAEKEDQIRKNNKTPSIDYNMMRLSVGELEKITLKPGEILKVSQTAQIQAGSVRTIDLHGKKGFNYGGGARFPLLDENGQYVLLEPADQISYTASPNNLTGGYDGTSGGNILAGFGQNNSRRWSLTQNSVIMGNPWGKNTHIGQVSVDHCYGYRRAKVGENRTTGNPRMNKTLANSQRVLANDSKYAEVYPVIAGGDDTRVIPASGLATKKAPFMVHSYSIKTEEENKRGTRMFARFNPKAHNVDFYNLSDEERDMLPYQTEMKPLTSWLNAPLDESANGQGFFGSSLKTEFGSNFVNTHSIPRQPIVSLAAFQDSFANGFNRLTESVSTEHAMARLPLLPQVSHAIGNSLAPSIFAPDKTEDKLANNPRPLADHSYLANRELWDDWCLSGIAPQPSPAFAQNRDQKKVATDFFKDSKSLPVARYRPVLGGQDATKLVTSFFTGNVPNDAAINNVASHLRVDGLFNVNSTSVEAWKTVLASLKGLQIVVRNENGVESIAAKDDDTPVGGVGAVRDIITKDASAMRADQWYGRRTLKDDEIEALAEALVKEIRKRGPFLSLADFVNRRVGTDKKLARAGAIQSALDSKDVKINKQQNTDRSVASADANRFKFPEAEEGAMPYGSPGIVKQGDILTPIAPILSARSDSFIIRAYGEAKDKTGKVTARAWCEAVVERDRAFVDPTNVATADPATLTPANRTFGRRFAMSSFRWLNSSEI